MDVPAISCRGPLKRYGDVGAVDGLDLEVRRGERFALLGPNGAGKTTTIEILESCSSGAGAERVDSGRVGWPGLRLAAASSAGRSGARRSVPMPRC